MTRTETWIARIEAGETIDWRRENLLLALDALRQGEQLTDTLIERDRQADDHHEQGPAR